MRELANRFGIHRATVWEIARSAGVDVRRPELSDKVRAQAARLRAEGMTLAEVASILRISNEAVRSAMIARGGITRPAGRRGWAK